MKIVKESNMKIVNIYYGLVLLLAFLPAGCTRTLEEPAPGHPSAPLEFTGVFEQSEATKTVLAPLEDGVHKVKWSIDDQVFIGGVTYKVSSTSDDGLKATFTAVDGSANPVAQVSKNLSNKYLYYPKGVGTPGYGYYVAWYPTTILEVVNQNSHRFRMPGTQYYREGRIDNLPMLALAETDQMFVFRNLCAVLAIDLVGSTTQKVGKIRVQGTSRMHGISNFNNDGQSGYITLHPENPVYSIYSSGSGTTIELDCLVNTENMGVALNPATPKTFHIAINPGEYNANSLTINVYDTNETIIRTFTLKKKLTAQRNHIYSVTNGD